MTSVPQGLLRVAKCQVILGDLTSPVPQGLLRVAKCQVILGDLTSSLSQGLLRVAKCQVILGDVAGADSALKQAAALDPQNAGLVTERRNMDAVARLSQELELAYEKVTTSRNWIILMR